MAVPPSDSLLSRESLVSTDLAIFLPSLAGGGAERVFVSLAGYIADRGFKVDLVVATSRGELRPVVPKSVRLVDLNCGKPSRSMFALVKYIRQARPKRILAALTHANIAVSIAHLISRSTAPLYISERANVHLTLKNEKSCFDYFLTRLLGRLLYRRASVVIAVSRGVASSVNEVFNVELSRQAVLYNPVNVDQIDKLKDEIVTLPWEDGQPVIVSVGRLHKQKDYPALIRAFSKVNKETPCHLIILGEGEDRGVLEELARNENVSDKLWMPGFVENPYAIMAKCNVFVLASRWEGLPNVLIEALAVGLPVVSTRCPSGAEEILADGKYGHLVPVGDVNQLARAISLTLKGQVRRFERNQALAEFELSSVVDKYIDVLQLPAGR